MILDDINLLFNPKTREYVIVSGKNTLTLNEKDFKEIKKSMNGISYALQMKRNHLQETWDKKAGKESLKTEINRIC